MPDSTVTSITSQSLTPASAPDAAMATGPIAPTKDEPRPVATVFISYRVNPDQRIAEALKKLLETSITPPPLVFVSGAGGLRPSSVGYKPQLQRATQNAAAFVGIITEHSKEREWIFFEAGAAWGRGQLYAPLLVGVSPSDLPSSIADYQATKADVLSAMELLVTEIARCTGGDTKLQFSKRHQAFLRAIAPEGGGEDDKDDSDAKIAAKDAVLGTLLQARKLIDDGKLDEADKLFEDAEKGATEIGDRATFAANRIAQVVKDRNVALQRLYALMPAYGQTVPLNYWIANLEQDCRPHAARAAWEKLLEAKPNAWHRENAIVKLARAHEASGRSDLAWKGLRQALSDSSLTLREKASQCFTELFESAPALERLLVLVAGFSPTNRPLLDVAARLAWDEDWKTLFCFFSKALHEHEGDGNSAHTRAAALEHAECVSLAYELYLEGMQAGMGVSRAAAANLLGRNPVPSAGLRLFRDYAGGFDDAANPGFPHQVRAGLESTVKAELSTAKKHDSAGERIVFSLAEFLASALTEGRPTPTNGTRFTFSKATLVVKDSTATAFSLVDESLPARAVSLSRMPHLDAVWIAVESIRTSGLYKLAPSGDLEGIYFGDLKETLTCEWRVFALVAGAAPQ